MTEGNDYGEQQHEHHARRIGQASHPADAQPRVPHVVIEADARHVSQRHCGEAGGGALTTQPYTTLVS